MSQENVEKVRRGIEAFNRRDYDAALLDLRDDITWERFLSRAEATTPVVRGKEQLRAVWESQVEALDLRIEPDELIAVGDRVIASTRMLAHGSASEIALTEPVTWVWSFDEDGLAWSVESFASREEALEAAG